MGYNSKYNGAEVEAILDRVGDCITKGESVDFATDLTGVPEATHEEFTYRPSAGRKSIRDKSAVIRRIKGNSLVWNQYATFKDSWTEKGLTCVKEGNTIHLYGTVTEAFSYDTCQLTVYLPQGLKRDGRKYLISLNAPDGVAYGINGSPIEKTKPHFWSAEADSVWFGYISIKIPVGTTVDYVFSSPQIIDLTQMFGAGNEPSTIEEFHARIPEGVDINAYNEGQLISMNANAIETTGFNQWDEEWEVGEINEDTGENADVTYRIRSKNFIPIIGGETYNFHCASNGQTLYFSVACYDENKKFIGAVKNGIYPSTSATNANYNNPWTFEKNVAYIKFATAPLYGTNYKNDICINLSHTGVRNGEYEPYWKSINDLSVIKKYFNDGMRSAGSAYDEIVFDKSREKWVAIKRIGSVDLGSLSWNYTSTEGQQRYVSYGLQGIINVPNSNGDVANTRTTIYLATYFNGMWDNALDKTLAVHSGGAIAIKDLSYNDVTTFKNSLQGVMLYYELAEPIVTDIDDVVDFVYSVEDFGTEKMLSDAPSSPLKADIVYQFNAEGRIRDNSRNIESLEGQIQTLYEGKDTTGSIANTIERNTISFDKLTEVPDADGLIKGRDTKDYIDAAIENAEDRIDDNSRLIESLGRKIQTLYEGEDTTGSIANTILHLQSWGEKQDALVSGKNIKTINGESILGSGNITISGGGGTSGSAQLPANYISSNRAQSCIIPSGMVTIFSIPQTEGLTMRLSTEDMESDKDNSWVIRFSIGADNTGVYVVESEDNFSLKWANGIAPTFENGKYYEMSFRLIGFMFLGVWASFE